MRFPALMMVAMCLGLATSAPPVQAGELRFSSQRSLLRPDPFLRHRKPPPASAAAPPATGMAIKPAMAAPDTTGPETADQGAQVWGRLDSRLLILIGEIETHFGVKAQIRSGCRTAEHNRAVGGAAHSFHLSCRAADIALPGVSTPELRDYALSLPDRGGIGTYCSTPIVHVDVGPRRQWHWGCHRFGAFSDPFELN